METYERWHPKDTPKSCSYVFICMATGYLFGHTTTISTNLSAASFEDAQRMFDIMLHDAALINLSDYHIVRKD